MDEAIHAWLSALQQTAGRMTFPRIPGEISIVDFQPAFKAVSEKTTLSPSGLHFSIWKVLARDDSLVKWLSIMMSLPFIYGFVSERWTHKVDVMIKTARCPEDTPSENHWDPQG